MRISDWSSDVCSSDLIGLAIVAVRLNNLAPSSELERALQTPTFEALQHKADEAMFERRALAADKERAIAENELGNKTELARRAKQLIAEARTEERRVGKGSVSTVNYRGSPDN